jgi:hypothetical protein
MSHNSSPLISSSVVRDERDEATAILMRALLDKQIMFMNIVEPNNLSVIAQEIMYEHMNVLEIYWPL